MSDEAHTNAAAAPSAASGMPEADTPTESRCPWCSELLPVDATVSCPACHANLHAEGETRLPGLTEVETSTATRVRLAEAPRRSKLLAWISGDIDDEPFAPAAAGAPEAVALPPRDVRREMLRLKLEAEGLTVTPAGSIELPAADPASATPAVDAPVTADASPPHVDAPHVEDIRKAS